MRGIDPPCDTAAGENAVNCAADCGAVECTLAEDGDPLDVLVVCQAPIQPMCIVQARPVGVVGMRDDMGQDDKIIAAWNGMMISALARGYQAFGDDRFLKILGFW